MSEMRRIWYVIMVLWIEISRFGRCGAHMIWLHYLIFRLQCSSSGNYSLYRVFSPIKLCQCILCKQIREKCYTHIGCLKLNHKVTLLQLEVTNTSFQAVHGSLQQD